MASLLVFEALDTREALPNAPRALAFGQRQG